MRLQIPTKPQPERQKKLRQAEERKLADGKIEVQVLCSQCRRDDQSRRQLSLSEMLKPRKEKQCPQVDEGLPLATEVKDCSQDSSKIDTTVCHRCRRSLVVDHMSLQNKVSKGMTGCAFSAKLKQYKRNAVETHAQWCLTDSQAFAIMRAPCVLCQTPADPSNGRPSGITRLRSVKDVRGMGPYTLENVEPACAVCNMIKGTHTLGAIREICCTIATHRGFGDFGKFPERFVNNTSRKSRSCYLGDTARKAGGTIASKTHSLSNAEFNQIVSNPCYYCGKPSNPPAHHNGLDRLDNSIRVYTLDNAVSCCGTCNIAKGKFTETLFFEHCRLIAKCAPVEDKGTDDTTSSKAEVVAAEELGACSIKPEPVSVESE